jgi:branched-chain amino acid transport system ATP-binding protein
MAILQTHALTVAFGGLKANNEVSIRVDEGQFVGLIGPNGAGKTTFIDAITGYVKSTGGIEFRDQEIGGLKPHLRARRGLVRTFQSLELFEDLTVEDNLLAAAQPPHWSDIVRDIVRLNKPSAEVNGRVEAALAMVGLEDARKRNCADLSHGQRKLVGVARALAADPKLVLLDEPAAGLDTAESQVLGARLRTLPANGVAVFLIDHDMGLVLSVCDYIYVLDFGQIIAEGTPAQIRTNPQVIEAYLGESAGEMQETSARQVRGDEEDQ